MAKKSNRVNSIPNSKPIPTSNPNDALESDVQVPDTFIVGPEEANKKPPEFSFFNRLVSIPFIRSSTSKAQEYVNQHSLSRFAYQKVESTVKYATSIALPYAEKYKSQLLMIDQLGCQSLDYVENIIVNGEKKAVENSDDVKIFTLATKVKESVTFHLQSLPHSRADISRLAETNQLLNEAFQSIQKANTRLHEFVSSLKDYTQLKTNQRFHELTTDLIHRLDAAAVYIKEHQHTLVPSRVQVVVDPLVTFATNEYEIVRNEVLKPDLAPLQKATNILHMTQEYVLPLIQKSIHGVEEQLKQQYRNYANNSKVVIQDVKSSLGFVKVNA